LHGVVNILTLFFAGLGPVASLNSPIAAMGPTLRPLPRKSKSQFSGLG
jgi:hypothetical protein